MLLRNHLELIDFRAKRAIILLNEFDLDTYECCTGHIQEGDYRHETAIRYVPGLKILKEKVWYDEATNSVMHTPTQYILDENQITLEDLHAGDFCNKDNLIYHPLEKIFTAKHANLMFKPPYLNISYFNAKDKRTKELKTRLYEVYAEFEVPLKIQYDTPYSRPLGFDVPGVQFNPQNIDRVIEKYGSMDEYWKQAISTVIELQTNADLLWGRIADVCEELLKEQQPLASNEPKRLFDSRELGACCPAAD